MLIDFDNFYDHLDCLCERLAYSEEELSRVFSRNPEEDLDLYARRIEQIGYMRLPLETIAGTCKKYVEKLELTGWHQTKVLDSDFVVNQGLLAQDKESFTNRIVAICNSLSFKQDDVQVIVGTAQRYFERDSNRRNGVCFYSIKKLEQDYLTYSEQLGGESFTWSVDDFGNERYCERVRNTGISLAIKFKYSLDDIPSQYQERIFLAISRSVIIWKLYKVCYPVVFDAYIERDVPVEDLIEIAEINKAV